MAGEVEVDGSTERELWFAWCGKARERAELLRSLCTFAGSDRLPGSESFLASIGSLLRRTERPEIRVLILGPLKSGKSTLINVLLNNPRLSQITQYPAYPCFVEVRNLKAEDENEHAVFHRAGASAPEDPCSLEECRQRLDELLDGYIQGKEGGTIAYQRVEQRIDLNQTSGNAIDLQGLDIVTIDSPGLFFQRAVDREVFGVAEPADGGSYSGMVQNMYHDCDIAIFVIRWEQLFFHVVGEYLSRFCRDVAGHRNLRTFVLVNASTQGRVQDASTFRRFDQTSREHTETLTKYFVRHVAEEGLLAELARGKNLSLHFCDLLELAVQAFDPEAPVRTEQASSSGEVIGQIRQYIFDRELPRRRRLHLEELLATAERQARQVLEEGVRSAEERTAELEGERQGLAEKLAEREKEREVIAGERNRSIAARKQVEQRLAVLRSGAVEQSQDPAIVRYVSSRAAALDPTVQPAPEAAVAERNCQKIYMAWAKGKFGRRTLKSLADRVWNDASVVEGVPSLAEMCSQVRLRVLREQIRILKDRVTDDEDGLGEAIRQLDEWKIIRAFTRPAATYAPTLLHFHKSRYWFFQWHRDDLWGFDGARVIDAPGELDILEENKTHFPGQIWGEPWRWMDWFDPQVQKPLVWKQIEGELFRHWSARLVAKQGEHTAREVALGMQISEKEGEIRRLITQVEEKRQAIADQQNVVSELRGRADQAGI